MKKILYIGHSFHKKTLSTEFFIKVIEKQYNVDFFWTLPSSIEDELNIDDINEKEYHAIVFFQTIPSERNLRNFECQNIILIPMYDNDIMIKYDDWEKYINYKFICFSHSMYEKFNFLGFKNNLYLQYSPPVYLEPETTINNNNKFNIFFWQRSNDITWDTVKKLLNSNIINSVHMHRVSKHENDDLWFNKPSDKDILDYNITFSSWFDSHNELKECIKRSDIFIAPRLYEGIGQAFLEAMTLGKCVIAPDFPTANEYIVDNNNGLLYSLYMIRELDVSHCLTLGANAKKSMSAIRDNWEVDKEGIASFIDAKLNKVDVNKGMKGSSQELLSLLDGKYKFIVDDIQTAKLLNFNLYKSKNKVKSLEFLKFINLLNAKINLVPSSNKIVIYGAGTGADLILSICGNKIEYLLDKDKQKDGTKFKEKYIYDVIKIKNSKNITVIISLFDRVDVIEEYLVKNMLISRKNIINLDDEFHCINL